MQTRLTMKARDLCQLAADLAEEHGLAAVEYARRAHHTFEANGVSDRAHMWHALSILLDDIVARRLDPERPLTIH